MPPIAESPPPITPPVAPPVTPPVTPPMAAPITPSIPPPPPATGPAPRVQNVPALPAARALALRITASYVAFGILWIVASGAVASLVVPSGLARPFQATREILFIALTSLLLYFLVRRFVRSLQQTQDAMNQKLTAFAGQYQRLFERSPSAMLIFDPSSRRILAANDVCLLLYGYPREKILTMKTLDLLHSEDEKSRAAANTAYLADTIHPSGPWQVRRDDGRIILVDVITHQVEFNGRPARIAQITDVTQRIKDERALADYRQQLEHRVTQRTAELSLLNHQLLAQVEERRRIEEELRAATAAAQAASSAKSTFLANTSHEIRTPLTSILGYADLLADQSLTQDQRSRYVDIVRDNAHHLHKLIDDLLDLSRAEMGEIRLAFDDHSPREIAQQAVEVLGPRAREKNLPLHLAIQPDVPEKIHTDGVRLRQILLNLLNNAIKFTPAGSVSLAISRAPAGLHGPALRFAVSDTGIGLDPRHFQRIFEPFYQVDQGHTKRFGGSGLGLAISRQLAGQLGGQISVESTPGQGSTFTLLLPFASAAAQSPPPNPASALSPTPLAGHILFAEDNANIRLLIAEYLTRAGARVTPVSDGQQAVQFLRDSLSPRAVPGQAYDLVLLDLHMPVLDGLQAQRQIRDAGFRGPIVGLTADFADKSPAHWTREGWDAMAAKPVDRQAFIPLLARLIAQSGSNAAYDPSLSGQPSAQ